MSSSSMSSLTYTKPLDAALMAAHSAFVEMKRPAYEKVYFIICGIT